MLKWKCFNEKDIQEIVHSQNCYLFYYIYVLSSGTMNHKITHLKYIIYCVVTDQYEQSLAQVVLFACTGKTTNGCVILIFEV